MVKYDYTYALAASQGDSRKATTQYIVAHETGNANNTGSNSAKNEAIYMKSHWQNAYTHAIAGWDRVYIVGEPGYIAYGAGTVANGRSPFQIELARYSDRALAIKAYHNYVEAIRGYAKKYGIPLTLDGAGNGVKSHKWVTDNIWGDHQDPYSYLSSLGISKSKLASDLANGVGNVAPSPKPAAKPTPKQKPSATTGWIAETGKFKLNTAIKLRSGASTSSGVIAVLQAGDVVKYNAFIHSGGYVWIRQPRGNGYGYLATGVSKNGRRQDYWGSFS